MHAKKDILKVEYNDPHKYHSKLHGFPSTSSNITSGHLWESIFVLPYMVDVFRHTTARWKKKRKNLQRHNASAERGSQNATGHKTHNGTLENVKVYYALRCIVSMY